MKCLTAIFLSMILVLYACNEARVDPGISRANEEEKLKEADEAFSGLSETRGMKAAYIDYIDSNGILLRPGHLPLSGANAIDYLIQQNDASFNFTRRPQSAVVAESGEIGYTYGIYSYHFKANDTVHYGTYVSIWKKQKDGSWKFILDSGNYGIGEQY